ncbi:hypothetical protein [Massilia pseudoviolaceinigra]|uniref:hypothetical protein n=1 Tax=Massilia pseudoviolaceinigra TaxID=3057165 RepID=UPI002796C114|nr:hypothetical protein [Massilia sp. CCM 9206]MDQ1921630.1 hypothetical protein [Massilia sp. CCM 9206]
MTDYAKTAARADQSLRRKGGTVVLRRAVPGTYDPGTGTGTPASTADYPGTGVKIAYLAEDIDGTLIRAGDQQLLLSPLQREGAPMPVPTTADLVLIGAEVLTIAAVQKVEPTDVAVLFTLQLRGV